MEKLSILFGKELELIEDDRRKSLAHEFVIGGCGHEIAFQDIYLGLAVCAGCRVIGTSTPKLTCYNDNTATAAHIHTGETVRSGKAGVLAVNQARVFVNLDLVTKDSR